MSPVQLSRFSARINTACLSISQTLDGIFSEPSIGMADLDGHSYLSYSTSAPSNSCNYCQFLSVFASHLTWLWQADGLHSSIEGCCFLTVHQNDYVLIQDQFEQTITLQRKQLWHFKWPGWGNLVTLDVTPLVKLKMISFLADPPRVCICSPLFGSDTRRTHR